MEAMHILWTGEVKTDNWKTNKQVEAKQMIKKVNKIDPKV